MRLSILVAVASGVLVSVSLAAPTEEASPAKIATMRKDLAAKKAVLVDVREKSEWDAGHLAGAVLLPMSELERLDAAQLAKRLAPAKKKTIYTYCAAGFRATRAADQLKRLGYDSHPFTAGGYQELLQAGFKKAEAVAAKSGER